MAINLTWYSHACFLIQTNEVNLLVDPFLTGNSLAPVSPDEVETDYILVSHGHCDHLGDTVEIAKRTGAIVVSNPEICGWLHQKGISNTHAMQLGGAHTFSWGTLKMTLALHSSPTPDGGFGGNPCGFIFYIDGKKIYHACDTGLFYDMTLIGEEKIDLALLPIGDNFTMGPSDAIRALHLIKPKKVIPIHYNTFDVIRQDPVPWGEDVRKQTSVEPILLSPGGSYKI
jgi:L-ascorbate metabolism protein UlaG (beta-lactamase superfamily)